MASAVVITAIVGTEAQKAESVVVTIAVITQEQHIPGVTPVDMFSE